MRTSVAAAVMVKGQPGMRASFSMALTRCTPICGARGGGSACEQGRSVLCQCKGDGLDMKGQRHLNLSPVKKVWKLALQMALNQVSWVQGT